MRENFITQIQSRKKGNFNNFSRLYPTPNQQQAIESFANFLFEGRKPARTIKRKPPNPLDGIRVQSSVDEMLQQSQIYDVNFSFDLENIQRKMLIRGSADIFNTQQNDLNSSNERTPLNQSVDLKKSMQIRRSKNAKRLKSLIKTKGQEIEKLKNVKKEKEFLFENHQSQRSSLRKDSKRQLASLSVGEIKIQNNENKQMDMNRQVIQLPQPQLGVTMYQEHKRLNYIIQDALKNQLIKHDPQNASLSKQLKRAQIAKYLHKYRKKKYQQISREYKFSLKKLNGGDREFDRVMRQFKSKGSYQMLKKLKEISQGNMLTSFQNLCDQKRDISTDKCRRIYEDCYSFLHKS